MVRYLITGGSGFIGSHLTDALLARGDAVVVLDNLATGRIENLASALTSDRFEFVQGSVLDELAVDKVVSSCDVVIHLAAAVGVKLIVEQRLSSLVTNIRGSENMIEAAHRYRRKILLASTSEIYGKNPDSPLSETSDSVLGSPTVARWAYSTAKAVDEILAYAYHEERGLPTVVVRLFNTVGPRQSPAYGMVIPRLVRQALANKPLTVYGDGSQTRCFCHVTDVVAALMGLIDRDDAVGDVFNVGAHEEVSMAELAQRIITACACDSTIRFIPYDQAYERGFEDMARRVPDTTKLERLTGWRSSHSLEDILSEMIQEAAHEVVPQTG